MESNDMETMKQENLLGMDIRSSYSQISYQIEGMEEPFSYEASEGNFQIPNVLFYGKRTKKWYSGEEAKTKKEEETGIFLEQWDDLLAKEEPIKVGEKEYLPIELFVKMVALHIQAVVEEINFQRLVFTAEQEVYLAKELETILKEELDLNDAIVNRITHNTAFTAFALHQEACNGVRNVGLIEYYGDEISYQYLGRTPAGDMLQVKTVPLTGEFRRVKGESKDEKFAAMLVNLFYRYRTPIVYLTGDGFDGEWMQQTLKVLCHNRRAFVGENLFTKGAFFFGKEEAEKRNPKLLADGLCQYDIGVVATIKGQSCFAPVLGGGCDWYGRRNNVQLILEDGKQITIVYQNLRTKELEKEVFLLAGMAERPEMTTRIELEIAYTSQTEGYMKVKDIGFGELYPSSRRIWVKKFTLDQERGENNG